MAAIYMISTLLNCRKTLSTNRSIDAETFANIQRYITVYIGSYEIQYLRQTHKKKYKNNNKNIAEKLYACAMNNCALLLLSFPVSCCRQT